MTEQPPCQSYDPSYFAPLFQVEDRHFWFRARNQVIAAVAKRLTADLPRGYRVLELGCGTGNVLRVLERVCTAGTVIGMDLFLEGLRHARQRTDALLVQADMHTPPFGLSFNVIGLFDVLEHIPDDRQVLCDLHDMLVEGGSLLLTVPAHPYLWSYFDEASRHCRRYEREELSQKLTGAGYQVEQLTYYMATIFPLVWIGRKLAALSSRRPASDATCVAELTVNELRVMPVINEVLASLLALEARLLAHRKALRWGTSLLAVARKNSTGAS